MTGSATTEFFGSELRRGRQAAGLTQEQLSTAVTYSSSLIAMIECGRRVPSADFTRRADEALKTGGLLERIRTDLVVREAGTPTWFQPWLTIEEEASSLLSFQPLVVPGLLQTDEYAHAVLRWPASNADDERIASIVATRLERQRILTRDRPPEFVAIVDERVLACPVGGPDVMHGQLCRLAEVATSGRVIVQVVPLEAETHLGLCGAFVLACYDGTDVVYLDNQVQGYVVNSPEIVAEAKRRWNAIRSEALPMRQSIAKITEAAERWKP